MDAYIKKIYDMLYLPIISPYNYWKMQSLIITAMSNIIRIKLD